MNIGGNESLGIHKEYSFAACLYNAEFMRQNNILFENVRYIEDKLFTFKNYYLANKIIMVDKLMYLYRQNPMSIVHSRTYGIEYYKFIVEGYLEFDNKMKKISSDKAERFTVGRDSARLYLLDMIDEHFQQWKRKKTIKEFICNNYSYLKLLKECKNDDVLKYRYEYMVKHSIRYVLKNRVHGALYFSMRQLRKISIIRKIREYTKFKEYILWS